MAQGSPADVYQEMVRKGTLKEDKSQLKALGLIQQLHTEIQSYDPPTPTPGESSSEIGGGGGFFSSFFGSAGGARQAAAAPRGLYLWGGVGCGKTMLMDMFYRCQTTPRKRRVHFHSFMLELHRRMHELRSQGTTGDPIPHITDEIVSECWLLCFDEFQVTDIADALVMRRLFSELWEKGLVVFATSNRPPDDLYYNGIQRELFVPFIAECKDRSTVHHLLSPTDYRLMGTQAATYIAPLNEETEARAAALFERVTKTDKKTAPKEVKLHGRTLRVPMGSFRNGVARFSFADLCAMPKGAEDFLAIAHTFHTVFVTDVPTLTRNEMNQVRRFITLVDTLYENRVKVVFTAQAFAHELFVGDGGPEDEIFAFDRTVSRLTEMQSLEYLGDAGARAKLTSAEQELFAQLEAEADGGIDGLTSDQLFDVWNYYDGDLNGEMTVLELEVLMADLSKQLNGHSRVGDEDVQGVFAQIAKSDEIGWNEFEGNFAIIVEGVRALKA